MDPTGLKPSDIEHVIYIYIYIYIHTHSVSEKKKRASPLIATIIKRTIIQFNN
jgi:hypothetical protein